MYQIVLYVIGILIIIIILIAAYIKMKFRFWTLQPVFHIYDFHYYLFPPGIINPELPEKNKYCNFKEIETLKYDSLSEFQINQFVRFICSNYLKNEDNCYLPKKNNIMPYFEGHNASSFFSFYYEDELLMNLKKGTTVQDKRVIGIMTTRPLNVIINKGRTQIKMNVYYVDHLCVDRMYRKKGIAPQVIQTHHYHQRHDNKKIKVSLFKREDNLTGIVPLCVYNTYGYDMASWQKPIDLMPNIASLTECGKTNIHHLFDFMRENVSGKFDICIQPELSNWLELIRTKNIYIYMIICDDEVKSAYFFRKSCTFIRKGCEAISCFATIESFSKKETKGLGLFIQGFKNVLWKIANENNFKFLIIEDISDNNIIIDNLQLKTKPAMISPTAYFFYNYAYHTISSNKVFIMN